jgi:hypothetical protein
MSNLQHVYNNNKYMRGKRIVMKGRKLNPLTLCKDVNFNLYWSHALNQLPQISAPIGPLPGSKHPFSPPHPHMHSNPSH